MDYRKEQAIRILDQTVGKTKRNDILKETLNFPKISLDDMINKGYIEEVLISELAIFANENNTIMDLMTLYQEANIINIEKNTEYTKKTSKLTKNI